MSSRVTHEVVPSYSFLHFISKRRSLQVDPRWPLEHGTHVSLRSHGLQFTLLIWIPSTWSLSSSTLNYATVSDPSCSPILGVFAWASPADLHACLKILIKCSILGNSSCVWPRSFAPLLSPSFWHTSDHEYTYLYLFISPLNSKFIVPFTILYFLRVSEPFTVSVMKWVIVVLNF